MRSFGNGEFVAGRDGTVVEAGHGSQKAAAGNLKLGGAKGCGGVRVAHGSELAKADGLIDNGLAGVLANRVVGDEAGRRLRACSLPCLVLQTVGLSIEPLVVPGDAGQQGRTGDGAFQGGSAALREGGSVGGLIGLRAADGFVEGDGNRLAGGCALGRSVE